MPAEADVSNAISARHFKADTTLILSTIPADDSVEFSLSLSRKSAAAATVFAELVAAADERLPLTGVNIAANHALSSIGWRGVERRGGVQ